LSDPWDTTFNKAMNRFKKRGKAEPPTSFGHVPGYGLKLKAGEFHKEDAKARRERKTAKATADQSKVAELEAQVQNIPRLIQEELAKQMSAFFQWEVGGRQGPPPFNVPSTTGSNSGTGASAALVTPPANTAVPGLQFTPPANNAVPEAFMTPPAATFMPVGRLKNAPVVPPPAGTAAPVVENAPVGTPPRRRRSRS